MNAQVPGLRWGVVGAGRIAKQFVAEISGSRADAIVGIASRDAVRATQLASTVPNARGYATYEALLAEQGIDAVYIATLHPQHAEFIEAAAAAGKHILCEKPITMDAASAESAFHQAATAGVQLIEAMQYRFQQQTKKIRDLVTGGAIGTPLHVDVSCAFRAEFDPADRLFDPEQGGGGILDVGCYAMSYALMVADWATGVEGVEPATFAGGGHTAPTGVDDWAVAALSFDGGFTADVRSGTRLDDPMHTVIQGSAGNIYIDNPWTPGKGGVTPEIVLSKVGSEPETIVCEAAPLFGAEVAALERVVATGSYLGMTARQSIVNMRALDRWRAVVQGMPETAARS